MMKLITEFKTSLKNPYAEELIDLAFYRPVAFLLVKCIAPLPLTPNQISVGAMIAGIGAGIALAGGTAAHFVFGGLLFCLSNILDCSDGMIARLKKNGTKTGRIVDGLVDYVASGAVYVGFGIGLTKAIQAGSLHLPFNAWLLVALAIASAILHSISSDNCRNAFVRQSSGKADEDEKTIFSEELARLQQSKGHLADKVLTRIYLRYLSIQKKNPDTAAPTEQQSVSRFSVVAWNLIGPSTHITFFIVAALLYQPMLFFIFTIVAANLWMAGLFIVQQVYKRRHVR
jgi:phosphatidylglycerophosphate synthase